MESLTMFYYTYPFSTWYKSTHLLSPKCKKLSVGRKLLHWLISQNPLPFQVDQGETKRYNYALGVMMLSIIYAETKCPILTSL